MPPLPLIALGLSMSPFFRPSEAKEGASTSSAPTAVGFVYPGSRLPARRCPPRRKPSRLHRAGGRCRQRAAARAGGAARPAVGRIEKANRQLVVATIPDLQGYPIEDYGYQLGRTWGIGKSVEQRHRADRRAERAQVRIEVGYGLEPILTDALSSVIINTDPPAFKSGDIAGGIIAGADAIIDQLKLPLDDGEARRSAVRSKGVTARAAPWSLSSGASWRSSSSSRCSARRGDAAIAAGARR